MRIHVEGKVALVTGGSRGIGLAAAKALAEAWARVVIASRKPENLEQARVALEADGVKVDVVASNVDKEGAAEGGRGEVRQARRPREQRRDEPALRADRQRRRQGVRQDVRDERARLLLARARDREAPHRSRRAGLAHFAT